MPLEFRDNGPNEDLFNDACRQVSRIIPWFEVGIGFGGKVLEEAYNFTVS